MTLLLVFAIILAIKLPLLACSWYLYRIIHDVPEIEIENDGGEFVRAEFGQGPRHRGPHGQPPANAVALRRGDKGHVPDVVAGRSTSGHEFSGSGAE